MTLSEMSAAYADSAAVLRERIVALRLAERTQTDAEEAFRLRQRIAALMPLWREARELASLTGHYYERSYHRYERYTL